MRLKGLLISQGINCNAITLQLLLSIIDFFHKSFFTQLQVVDSSN